MVRARLALPDQETLLSAFRYDPETGYLYWKWHSARGFQGTRAGKYPLDYPQVKDPRAYVIVGLLTKTYKAHRAIWKMVTGDEPPENIDHIDGDGCNNRWSNLREASMSQNIANGFMWSTNTSGIKGVSWAKTTKRWRAEMWQGGKHIYIGVYKTFEEACDAREKACKEYFGEYAREGFECYKEENTDGPQT